MREIVHQIEKISPKIKTESNCTLYGKGLLSHHQEIPGSELWDNGSDTVMKHRESISKGDPLSKIVKVMTREEVLAVDLKPTGNSIMAQIANSTDIEKAAIAEELKKYLPQTSAQPNE